MPENNAQALLANPPRLQLRALLKVITMERILINATHSDELRVAIVKDSLLLDLDIENPGTAQNVANIYKGKISSIEPSLGAVFVDYGSEKHGFLPFKEISPEYFSSKQNTDDIQNADIHKLLRVGQEVVIQIDKDERGNKGAALTTFISLAGSYLVLMPNNPRAGGISRRIEGEEREQLRETINQLKLPEGMGTIIRTAGVNKGLEDLQWDLEILLQYWEAIKKAAVAKPGPYLIHKESDAIVRAVRDHLRLTIDEIIIDNEDAYTRTRDYIAQVKPQFTSKLKLYSGQLPLFSHFLIEQQIESAYERVVHLPSGGSLAIDPTEALVAIDINSARATKGRDIEETALNTNLEAADEVARQLKVRDMGGLIVIDFIDMLKSANQRKVETRMREALRADRARIQVGKISRFGLLEMSRQRLRSSLNKNTQITCDNCDGRGTIRSVDSLTRSILRVIEEQSIKAGSAQIHVQLPIDIATYLLNEKRQALHTIQELSQTELVIIPNHHLQSPHYSLKLIKDEHSKNTLSYKLAKIPKADNSNKKLQREYKSEPAINQFLNTDNNKSNPHKRSTEGSLIKRIWDALFGAEQEQPAKPVKRRPPAKRQRSNHSPKAKSGPDARKGQKQKHSNPRSKARPKGQDGQTKKPTANKPAKSQTQPHKTQANKAQNPAKQQTDQPAAKKEAPVKNPVELKNKSASNASKPIAQQATPSTKPATTAPKPTATTPPATTAPKPTATTPPVTTAPKPTATTPPVTTAPKPTATKPPVTTVPKPTATTPPVTTTPKPTATPKPAAAEKATRPATPTANKPKTASSLQQVKTKKADKT